MQIESMSDKRDQRRKKLRDAMRQHGDPVSVDGEPVHRQNEFPGADLAVTAKARRLKGGNRRLVNMLLRGAVYDPDTEVTFWAALLLGFAWESTVEKVFTKAG